MINPVSPITCLKTLMRADFLVMLRNRRSLIISTLFPIFLLIVWNNKGTLKAFGGPLFVLAIVISMSIMSLSIFGYTLAVARDREKGVFQRLRVTPAPSWTIMVSRLIVHEVANVLIVILVLIVGSHIYHVSLNTEDYLLVLLVSILAGAVFLSIGQALVGLIKSADTINAVARFAYTGLLLFGLLGQSGALGPTVKSISQWTPLGAVIAIFGGIPHLGSWGLHTSLALLTCFGYILLASAIGIKWFRWDAR